MKGGILLLTVLACSLLAGCGTLPYPREMGDMALLRTMGVDAAGEGVRLTVSTGARARGIQGEREDALVLAAEGTSLSGAAAALQGMSDSYVFFGYVDQLLLGEELARSGVERTLDYLDRDGELSLGARLWVVRGEAGEAAASGGGEGADRRLETLQADGEMGAAAISRTAGDVYADILERGAAYVPALEVGEDGTVFETGYAVFRGPVLAGYLEGDAARGLELLEGKVSGGVLEESVSGERVSLRTAEVMTWARFAGDGALSLKIKVVLRPAEYGRGLSEETREALCRRLEERELACVRAALGRLREWGADCAGLGPRAALSAPALWSGLAADWPERFARWPAEAEVRVELQE